ncbi:MAG: hypothetical protein ACLQU2_31700 [Candidatus Binataceae bacterium]
MTCVAKAKSHLMRPVLALACLCALALTQSQCGNITGCGGLGGSSGSGQFNGCSGGNNIPPQSSINFLGNVGTPFSATISDTNASYSFKGTVPLQVVYVNNVPPLRVVATNLSTTPSLLAIQALSTFTTVELASTRVPGSTISVNVGGNLPYIAGPPACDVRFYVTGPIGQYFQSLLEQNNNAYENQTAAPNLFLLGGASGNVDGVFVLVTQLIGPIQVNLVIDGKLAAQDAGSNFTVKSGCP